MSQMVETILSLEAVDQPASIGHRPGGMADREKNQIELYVTNLLDRLQFEVVGAIYPMEDFIEDYWFLFLNDLLTIILHEILHLTNPELTEENVEYLEYAVRNDLGFIRVWQGEVTDYHMY